MALKKLTLSVDERIIEKARRYASDHQTSISRLVTRFLDSLPDRKQRLIPGRVNALRIPSSSHPGRAAEGNGFSGFRISSAVERLIGILPPDVDISEHRRHLDDKYGR